MKEEFMSRWGRKPGYVVPSLVILAATMLVGARAVRHDPARSAAWEGGSLADTIAHGRDLVLSHDCGGCHGGGVNPAAPGWLAGETTPEMQFLIGPCYLTPGAKPCFHTHPRNLTPDNETGLGRFTERQIFNALRYGLRPEDTPDVEITSMTPGQGNFPRHPHYLAFPMPWFAWRYMPDSDLWAIAAYLKRGLKPVHNKVEESEGPPDFWASWNKDVLKIGGYPVAPFPTKNEVGGK
jgi:mono/diheme cytochrome c family protein